MIKTSNGKNAQVLVGVLKNGSDLEILMSERWYRVPKKYMPKRRFQYIAFYQPEIFGRNGKQIQYYAKVLSRRYVQRLKFLPKELDHLRAHELYAWLHVGKIQSLIRPIKNTTPRRVSFGFATLDRLVNSRNILELYNVAPTEEVIKEVLQKMSINFVAQRYVSNGKKGDQRRYYYVDFAIFCRNAKVAIECDNLRAHAGQLAGRRDATKDAFLRKNGWRVVRLTEDDIMLNLGHCLARIKKAVQDCGGLI